jgi:hypothetical protein
MSPVEFQVPLFFEVISKPVISNVVSLLSAIRGASLELLFCHFLLVLRRAVCLFNHFIHDLPAMGHHAGLKDFVIEV